MELRLNRLQRQNSSNTLYTVNTLHYNIGKRVALYFRLGYLHSRKINNAERKQLESGIDTAFLSDLLKIFT